MDKDIKEKQKRDKQDDERWDKAKAQVAKMLNWAPENDWDDKDWLQVESLFKEMKNKKS